MADLKTDIAEIIGRYNKLIETSTKLRNDNLSSQYQAMLDFEIQERLDEHFEIYPGQYQFINGDETKGMVYRLTDLFNEHFAKRTRRGELKLDRKGDVKFPKYKIFVKKNKSLEDQCTEYRQEIHKTIGERTGLADYRVESRDGFVITVTFGTLLLPAFIGFPIWAMYLEETIKKDIYKVLDTANTLNNYLLEEIKPLCLKQLTPGNYRESGCWKED